MELEGIFYLAAIASPIATPILLYHWHEAEPTIAKLVTAWILSIIPVGLITAVFITDASMQGQPVEAVNSVQHGLFSGIIVALVIAILLYWLRPKSSASDRRAGIRAYNAERFAYAKKAREEFKELR